MGSAALRAGTVLGLLTPGLGGFLLFVICAVCRLQDAEGIEVYFIRVCASCREGFFCKISLPISIHEFFRMVPLKGELIPVWLAMQGFSDRNVEAG